MNTSMFKFVIILSLVFFPLMAQSAIIDVPDDFETIQAAIDASENGDEIHVSPGEYVENIDFDGKIISVIGNPDNPEEVIIDGGGEGNVVMIANGETDDTILSGFTIRNGDTEDGGGIYCVDSYPTLLNLIVRDNVVTRNGGGIYCTGSDGNSIRMERLEVTSNQSWQGAGIFLVELDVSLSNSIISENYSTGQGSGIYCGPNTISNFDNLTITGNESRSIAAGISYISPIEASLTNSIFSGNQSEYDGAGFSLHSPDNQDGVLTVSNCIFTENEGRSTLSATFGTLQMDHVLLHHTPYQYQPIFLGEGERIFTNLTLSNNVGRWTIKQVAGSTIIRNTISYYNEMWEEMLVEGGDFEITYSDIEDGFEGEGNIDADPLFVDAENGDFHLTEDSPCIDVGNPDSEPDPDGTRVDMGGYYFHQEPQVIIVPDDYETIQAAIDAAEDGDEIHVSPGEYVENIDFTGKNISLIGDPENPEQVIIDGSGDGIVVTFSNAETGDAILSGFTIRNGEANYGGGVYCLDSYPTLANLIVRDNVGTWSGGGIYCQRSEGNPMRMENLEVTGNQSNMGGGIFVWDIDLTLINSTISENHSTGDGGGIYCRNSSSTTFDNLTFSGNVSEREGGGICYYTSEGTLTNSIFSGNECNFFAGGFFLNCIENREGVLNVSNCEFTENRGRSAIGSTYGTLQMDHVILHHNHGQTQSMLLWQGGEWVINNITVSNNQQAHYAIRQTGGSIVLQNSIFYDNEVGSFIETEAGEAAFSYCDIEGGYEGEGNIDADPLFVDAENGDYHLTEDSPCIDVGNPDSPEDPDGTQADMGAFYFHNLRADGILEVPDEYETIQAAIDGSENGDEIHVSAGEYVENIDFTGKDISLIGNPDNPEEVVIDGGGDGSVVVFSNGETNEAVLSGFTLQNGGNVHQGGGVYCNNSYPNLLNLIVRENMSASGGGGIYYSGDRESLISMENLQVIGNQSSGAAGIMLYEGEISISNSTISNNSSQRDAGGIWCGENTISTFDNLIITDNDCSRDGGGIYYINHSEASLSNSHISGNVAGAQGGGLFLSCWENEDGILSLHNCEIYENTGRSVIYFAYASVQIDHVTLHHNISHHQIINLTNSECVFNNCTVSDSRTGWFIVQAECSTVIQNSIVYNNDIWGLFPEQGELAEITFSNIQGGFEGEGNIDADPQFVDAENGDYQLTEDSPCIDVGNPDSDPDPDGTRVDMGVYYFHQEVRVLNVPDEFETIQAAIDAAEDGDEIRVSAGDYVENINFSGKDISIIGDPDSPESVIIDGNDNGSVVIFEEGEGEGAVLSGFTVRNGNSEFGGGIHGTGTSITLQNLIVTGNFIENGFGAGIYVNNCNLNIVNSEFSGNDAISNGQSLGGGIAIIENSQFEISETVVSNNLAWRGAGLYIQQSEGSLSNLDISENSGSGLTIDGCSPQVTDVVIRNNDFIAGRNDGATGIDVRGGNPIFNRVIITNNTMTSGGAVMVLGESTPEFNYCEISNNICEQGEGSNGIVAMGGHPIINNTTIYGHSFTGLYLRDTGSAIITNSIFWTNEDFSIYNAEGSWGFEIDYSDVEGGIDGMFRGDVNGAVFGENNIDSDPFFTDPDNNDFHLAANSACIDAGDPDTDPDPDGTRADMGAYYFHRDEDGILNVPDEYATIQAAINAAHDGAEVRVAPGGGNGENGAYMENINFNGKNISLIGDPDDPTSVVIDGNQNGSVVTFENWETNDAILTGFTITNGTGTDFNDGGGRRGGGVYSQPSSPTITYCIFRGNDADDGGAIHSRAPEGEMTSISIQNCQIFDNNTNSGGTIILARSEVVIYNTEITNNVGYQGAAIDCYWSDVTISNCTIANNIASENHNGGTIWSFMSEVDFTNSIAWGNGENHMVLWDSDVFNINYSDLQGGENNIDNTRGAQLNWGGNNIDSDPLFSDPDNSEYHLSANSPCIDTGDPESEPDPDGTRADMGAYYYNQEDEPDIEVSPEFLEFPATILGEASDFILTISNNGDANLTVSNISTQAPFSVAFGGELVIEPAQEHEVTVTFIPEESIEFDGLLMISSNDPVNPEIEVPLSGVGVSINNPPEVIREISDITVDEDPGRVDVINLDEVFVDPDEDELTFTFAGAPEELNVRIDDGNVLFFEPVENFNLPDGVEITVTADDGQDDNRDFGKIRQSRTVRGVSEGTDIESVNFTLLETDDSILSPQKDANVSTSFVIIITPVNDAPYVMDPIEDVVREEDSGYFAIADINEYFHDVDIDFEGDALNYTFRGDPEEVNMQIQENGWLTIDPDENYYLNEPVEIIVTAEDDHRATTITVFHLMIDAVNDVPVVVNEIGDVTVNEDCGHTIIADLDDVFYDPDGDDQEFSLNDGDVPDELNLLINDNNLLLFEPEDNFNMPEGIEVVVTADDGAENRMLRIALSSNVPDTNFNQAVNTDRDTRSVRKIAADISSKNSPRRDDSVEDSFMLVVRAINDAPVVQMEIPDITLEFNPGYVAIADLDDIFFDPDVITDDDLLRYTISEIPGELNINITEQNVLSVDPEGDFELPDGVDIVIIARDNENAVALAEFNLTINRPIHWDEPVETDFRHVFSISECDLYLEDQFGPLPDGSNIGAFTPDSLCVGHVVWDNDGVDLIAYGNNPDTEEIDGFIEGESVHFRVIEGFDQRELLGRIEYINEEPVRTYTVDSETSINLQVAGSSNSCNIIQLLHYDPVESNAQETHSILIEEVTLDDELLEIGDEIGAFAQDRMCVGATIFIGVPNDENEPWLESLRVGFSAVPDDNRTHELDGFEDGDEMYFEIWDHSSNTTYFAAVEFLAGDEHFVRHGRSRVNIRATRIFEQRIELTGDWQMISTHLVDLVRESIIDMWADVVEREHLEILKDHHGNFYLPDWGFNNIPRWRTEYGYQVKCSAEDMLIIRGRAVVDPDDSIHLRVGWSIIAYYLQEDVDAIIAFDNLVEVEVPDEMNGFQPAEIVTFLEIAKDAWGNFYLPEWNFCNLGDLRPDRAYQVKVSDDVDFVWSTGDLFIASGENELIIPEPIFFKTPELTNSNMSLLITKAPTSSDRYELGVISSSNVCIGSIVIDGDGPWGIALWGDDETTTSLDGAKEGEQFEFRIWDGNTEYSMSPEFQGGSNSFEKDGLGVVTFDNQLVPNEFSITSVYPNPFNSTAMVTYSLDEHASIAVKLFDLTGCEIATLYEGQRAPGNHTLQITGQNYASGLYLCRLIKNSNGQKATRKVVLIK